MQVAIQDYDLTKIEEYFPFDHCREGQEECISAILEGFDSGKRFAVLEAPTGSGKSAIGITIAQYFKYTYYLTIQKVLQEQIARDFSSHDLTDLQGRSNYPCTFWESQAHKLQHISKKKLNTKLKEKPACNKGFCRESLKSSKCSWCFSFPQNLYSKPNGESCGALPSLPPGMKYSACTYYEQAWRASASRICCMNFSSFLYQLKYGLRIFGKRDLL